MSRIFSLMLAGLFLYTSQAMADTLKIGVIGVIGAGKLDGKVIFSTSNPFGGRDAGVGRKALDMGVALADQPYLPGVHLVRAFNAWPGLGLHLEHGAQKKLG
ncbi:ABC transporter substrate-binding protein [Pseudomonas sp. IT-P100]|uniref:hypothetical protein n=1 Tax=Pseudomonas sp. IT-P100 TaxID=3026452 RepID=UPI0039E00343